MTGDQVCRGCREETDFTQGRGLCRRCYQHHHLAGTLDQFSTRGEALLFVDVSWHIDALCAETDPEIFFPEKGGSTRPAKAVCSQCVVRAECLDYALKTQQRFGIYGGVSERARRRLAAQAEADDLEGAA
jgi:hypothetical protein